MSTKRSYDERIEEIQKKKSELKAMEKQLKARKKEEERKARNHRLIGVGGAAEKYVSGITEEEMLSLMESVKTVTTGSSDYIDAETLAEQLRNIDFNIANADTKSTPASDAEKIGQIVLEQCGTVDLGKFSAYVTQYTGAIKRYCNS